MNRAAWNWPDPPDETCTTCEGRGCKECRGKGWQPFPEELQQEIKPAHSSRRGKGRMTAPKDTGGSQANRSGRAVELMIVDHLTRLGLPVQQQVDVHCTGIYGQQIRIDVVTISPLLNNFLAIESRWQDTPGTADEKLPFLIENIIHHYPYPTIIVADGKGARPGALAWARDQVGRGNLRDVLTIAEFISYCNRGKL
jgi:hypothetical protein